MRLRTVTLPLIAAAVAALPLAGVASAQTADRDCKDFSSQAEAQEALDAVPGDPERLDRDGDGEACESYDYGAETPPESDPVDEEPVVEEPVDEDPVDEEPAPVPAPEETDDEAADDKTAEPVHEDDEADDAGQVAVIPRGGVDTGDGSAENPGTPFLVGGVVALGAVAAAARRRAHTSR